MADGSTPEFQQRKRVDFIKKSQPKTLVVPRKEKANDDAYTHTRAGGDDWGTHTKYNREDGKDGRRSTTPSSRGGGNKNRYDDLLDED